MMPGRPDEGKGGLSKADAACLNSAACGQGCDVVDTLEFYRFNLIDAVGRPQLIKCCGLWGNEVNPALYGRDNGLQAARLCRRV
jgi:hypothetical protein